MTRGLSWVVTPTRSRVKAVTILSLSSMSRTRWPQGGLLTLSSASTFSPRA